MEKEVATLCGTGYGVGVNSGTDALFLALAALGVGEGDEVITSPYTFFATVEVIVHTGARPVLVDIETQNYHLDPARVEQAITSKTKAILPVHLFGHPADMKELSSIAQRHGLAVVEDACQAMGAQLYGKPVGSWGDVGCFFFLSHKNLGGIGDGGIITTSNPRRCMKKSNDCAHMGRSVNITIPALALTAGWMKFRRLSLRVKLKHLLNWNQRRRILADRYREAFRGLPLQLPSESPRVTPTYHLYSFKLPTAFP